MSKKVDVSFMRMVNTEDDWKREIKECGPKLLCIIDVYSSLWGPCEMLAGHFSNFFFDLGETCGIKFVRACADGIDSLKEHRQSSSPVFLIYLVRPVPAALAPAAPVAALRSRACAS